MHGPAQPKGSLKDALHAAVQPPVFPIHMEQFRGEMVTIDTRDEDFSIGAAKVMARAIPHSGTTLGYRIEAEGRTMAYMSDHQAPLDRRTVPDAVLELCDDDLLVHDGQYTDDEFAMKADWGHSTAAFAVHVAAEAGAKRLLLTHHDPSHNDREIDKILTHTPGDYQGQERRGHLIGPRGAVDRPRESVNVGPRPGPVPRSSRSLRHRHHHRHRH